MTQTETLTGITTRPIVFTTYFGTGTQSIAERFPTGTRVYVNETKTGFVARVVGTMWMQNVNLSDVEPE